MDVELPPGPYLKEDQLQDDEPPKAKRNGLVFDDEPITAGASEKLPDGPDELPPDPLLDTAKMVRETIDDEMALFEVLVVTDVEILQRHNEPGGALTDAKARVAVVTDPANPLAADELMLQWAQAGKPVVTWCSMTDRGRQVAREVASTVDPYLQAAADADDDAAARVRHIVKDPRDWQPFVDSFDGLAAGARKTVPPAPRRSSGGDGARSAAAQDDDYSGTSLRNAEKLLLDHPDRLLVVTDSQDALSDLYVLGENGVWRRGDVTLREWMGQMADDLRIKAALHDQLDGKELSAVLQRIRRLAEPATLVPIREQAATALRRLLNRGELQRGDVTTCLDTDLDDDLRYLGATNGVIDLSSGKLLPPAEGRRHLVTWQTPVVYDPAATHKDVDLLFGHLPEVLRIWWWAVLGYHLLGYPTRRFYVVEGPKGGGKSTLANALEAVLGPYASRPQDTALEAPRASAGLSPGNREADLAAPVRAARRTDHQKGVRTTDEAFLWRRCPDSTQALQGRDHGALDGDHAAVLQPRIGAAPAASGRRDGRSAARAAVSKYPRIKPGPAVHAPGSDRRRVQASIPGPLGGVRCGAGAWSAARGAAGGGRGDRGAGA